LHVFRRFTYVVRPKDPKMKTVTHFQKDLTIGGHAPSTLRECLGMKKPGLSMPARSQKVAAIARFEKMYRNVRACFGDGVDTQGQLPGALR
jgi:hypothetical protein